MLLPGVAMSPKRSASKFAGFVLALDVSLAAWNWLVGNSHILLDIETAERTFRLWATIHWLPDQVFFYSARPFHELASGFTWAESLLYYGLCFTFVTIVSYATRLGVLFFVAMSARRQD